MNIQQQKPVNIKALAWTVGVHVIILLLFLFISYTVPANENVIQEMGMEVNLGTDADGSGHDQPMAIEQPAPDEVAAANSAAHQASSETKEVETGNEADAPVISTSTKTNINRSNTATDTRKKPKSATQQQRTTNTVQQQRPRYVYGGSTGKGGNNATTNSAGTSEGNTIGNGDRGVTGGTPGATNYEGSPGPGTGGISHTLGGRTISPSRFEAEFSEGGKVVISVTVDRDGNIINKRVKSSSSSRLNSIAMQKLSQARFSKSPNAEPQQFGEITILFKTR